MLGKPLRQCSINILFCSAHFEHCMFNNNGNLIVGAFSTLFIKAEPPILSTDRGNEVKQGSDLIDLRLTWREMENMIFG